MINPAPAPEGVLDPQQPWWPTANMRDSSWDTLKAKLTGQRMPDGTQYETWVHLTSGDADRLIANIKKYGKYPQVNQTGGQGGYENLEAYQKWLVEEFLEKPFRDETNAKIDDRAAESRLKEIQEQKKQQQSKEETPEDDGEQKDLDKGQEELKKQLNKITTELDSEEQPDNSKQKEAQKKEEEEASTDFEKIQKSLDDIKGSLKIQSSDLGSINQNTGNSISSLAAIRGVLQSQTDSLKKQFSASEKQAAESSLEEDAGSVFSGDVESQTTMGSGDAEGIVQKVSGDNLTIKTTKGEFTKGAKISQGGSGGGMLDMIKGIAGKFLGGKGGGTTKLAGGGFLNMPFPATNSFSDGGIGMYPSTGLPGVTSYAKGVITPGIYNKPTRGNLLPGQAVIPLNRNVGKQMMGDKSPDQKRLRKYDQPLIDVMSQPLKAAGMAVLVTAGNFIKALGPLGGFFMPYVKGILTNMSRVLDIPANILMGLVAGPAYAAVEQQDKQQNAFASLWNDLMKSLGLNFLTIGDAADGDDKKKKEGDAPDDSNIPAADFKGSANAEKTWNFLKSQGFDENQTAGIMGNLKQESGFDPKVSNPYGYHGLMQWDPDTRWPRVSRYIKSINKDPDSLEGQLYALKWETDKYYKSAIDKIKNAKSIQEASDIWLKQIEIPGDYDKESPHRASLAKGIFKKYSTASAEVGMDTGQGKALNAFTLTGPTTGYPVPGVGTMHGKEALIQYEKGFTVLPIENNKFSLSSDPLATLQRWQQLMGGSPTTKRMFDVGGKFLFPQGQIDFGKTKSKQDVEAAIDSATYNTTDVVLGGKTYTVAVNPYTGEVHQVTKMVDAGWLNSKKNFGMESRTSVDPQKNKEEFDKVAKQAQVLSEVNARRAQLASQYASQMQDAEMNGELSDTGKERLKRMKEFNEILKNKQIQFTKALSKVTINPSKAASVYEERRNQRAELTAAGEWGNGGDSQKETNPIEDIQNAFSGMLSGLALMGAGLQGKVNTKEDWDNLKKQYDSTFKITTASAAVKNDKAKAQATAAVPASSSKQAKPASGSSGGSPPSSDISSPPGSATPKTTAELISDMSSILYC